MTAAFHGKLWTMVKCARNVRCFLPDPRDPLLGFPEWTVHVVSKGTRSFQLSVFIEEYMFLVLVLFEDKFKELGLHPTFFNFYFFIFLILVLFFSPPLVPLYYFFYVFCSDTRCIHSQSSKWVEQ